MNESRWQRLSSLLDDLFELDADAREQRLRAIEADDAELARELRQLLDADANSGLLDAGVARAAPTVMTELAEADAAAVRAESGKRLGHYRLIERVGSGGMGEVWRGERVGDFEQQVAIKLIRPLLDSPALRERFARERRILARLDHPGIARLLDGGVSDDGTPWYAMEFVRGQPITAHAEARGLDARARVELLLQVCDATAHAHSQLVVHRDLKPSNVLVDAEGRVRVLDFGIARLLDESADAQLTGTGVRVFSPAYAAPEQIRGEAVGTSADVFALGAVLFELLTGRVPHPQRSAAPDKLISQLADEVAPRPSQALRETVGHTGTARTTGSARIVSGDLDTIVATALQPEAARRYAGAAQLADDMRRWLDGRPIAAQPDTAGYRMRKFVARHRIAVGSASAVLLALIGGLGLALWQANVARQHAARADAEAARANLEAQRAEDEAEAQKAQVARTRKVKEFLVSIFLQADPMRASADGPPDIAEAFDRAVERARSELADDPVLQADVFDDFGEIRAGQGRFDDAQALFEQALAVAEMEYGPAHPVVAESLVNLGVLQDYRDRTMDGAPYIERAVAILEQDDGGDPLAYANAVSALSGLRQMQGRLKEAADLSRQALAISRRYRDPNDLQLAVHITNVAILDANEDRLAEAETGFEEAMRIVARAQGEDSPHLIPALMSVSEVHYARGEPDKEHAAHQRALRIAEKHFDGDHPWKAQGMVEAGYTTARDEDSVRGEAMMRDGIAMFERLRSPRVITGLRRLGLAQHRRGDSAGALASFERGLATCQSSGQAEEQHCIVLGINRAEALARLGRAEEALIAAEAGAAALQKLSPTGLASERSQAAEAAAIALTTLGRKDEALARLDEALQWLVEAFGEEHGETRSTRALRAELAAR